MSLNDLLHYYHENIDKVSSIEDIADSYAIKLNRHGNVENRRKYAKYHDAARELIIEGIINYFTPAPPKLTPKRAQKHLKRYIDSDEYKHNQERIAEQQRIIEEQRKQIEEMKQKLIEETNKNKSNFSKLIVEGIPKRKPLTPAINEIPASEPEPDISAEDAYGRLKLYNQYGKSEEFKQSHRNMTFDEYVEKTKYDSEKINQLLNELNNSKEY